MGLLAREALSPLAIENVYHVGFVVPDLAAAMREFSDQFGASWANPTRGALVAVTTPGGLRRAWRLDVTYSREGPPFFELVRGAADPACIWDTSRGPRLHHLGMFVTDVGKECDRLTRLGMRVEGVLGPASEISEAPDATRTRTPISQAPMASWWSW